MNQKDILEMMTENTQLRINVKELQGQLQYSYKRISALTKKHEECIHLVSEVDISNYNQDVFKDMVFAIDEEVSLKNRFPKVISDLPRSKQFKFRD
jgi:regulator of replication initiation timing|tara:strand:- start:1654 stop:1941 length:288 start_codon:yes stop_codon:yes gene_type:complete